MTEITDKAQELLAGRIDAVRKLSERQHAATQARATADAAERDAAAAWSDATGTGWTSSELRKLGLAQPATRRGGRSRTTRSSKRPENTATEDSASNGE